MRAGWRSLGAPALIFLLCDLVLLAPGVFEHGLLDSIPGRFELDAGQQFGAWRAYARDAVLSGRLPEWNPHLFVGGPFLGSLQAAVFYPPNLALLPLPVPLAMTLGRLLHLLLAQLGAFALVRRLGGGSLGALLAGAAFGLGSQFVLRIDAGHVCQLDAQSWTPWVVLSAVLVLQGNLRRGLLLAVFSSAMQLMAGYPQIVQVTWFALLAFVPCFAWSQRLSAREALKRGAALFAVVPPAAGAIAAATLLPAFELANVSARGGFDPAFVGLLSFPPESLATLAAPGVFGGVHVDYWGQGYLWETCLYVGVVPLGLAAFGAATRRRAAAPFVVTALWLGALALGRHNPLFLPFAEHVPGLGLFRGPCKYLIPLTLCLAVLAGLGLGPAVRRGRSWPAFALGAVLVALAATVVTDATDSQALELVARSASGEYFGGLDVADPSFAQRALEVARDALAATLLWVGAGLALLVLLRGGRVDSQRAAKALVVLALFELLAFGSGRVSAFSAERYAMPDALREAVRGERVALLKAGDQEVNRAFAVGLESLSGYEAVLTAQTNAFYNAWEGRAPSERRFMRLVARVDSVTRLLNQRHVVVPAGFGVPGSRGLEPPLEHVLRSDGYDVWRDPGALPRAYLAEVAAIVADPDELLAQVVAGEVDPRQQVLLAARPRPTPLVASELPQREAVELVSHEPERVRIKVATRRGGVLVVSDANYPGWVARANGVLVPLETANGLVRAVQLPPGSWEVELEFVSLPVRAGLWLTVLASLAFAFLAWNFRRGAGGFEESR